MLRPRSLRVRLSALAALLVAAAIAITSAVIILNLDRALARAVDETLHTRLAELADEVNEDRLDLTNNRAYAQVLRTDGSVVATTFAAAGRTLLDDASLATLRRTREEVHHIAVVDTTDSTRGRVAVLARLSDDGRLVVLSGVDAQNEALARGRVRLGLLVAGPVLVILVGAAVWVVTGAALRPAERMADEAAAISLSEPGRRLPIPASDTELAHLGQTLNSMIERIEHRYAHERAFIDDASHEMRTPLAILRGEMELALGETDPIVVRESLQSAIEEADRLDHLTEGLLTLARADTEGLSLHLEQFDLAEVAEATVSRLRVGERLSVDTAGPPASVRGDRLCTERILMNLLNNATRHARSRIEVRVADDLDGPTLTVCDDGEGFAPEFIPHALDRFARGDTARTRRDGGTGLGLAIVDALSRAQGGSVELANGGPLGGASVTVRLRRA